MNRHNLFICFMYVRLSNYDETAVLTRKQFNRTLQHSTMRLTAYCTAGLGLGLFFQKYLN